MAKQKNKLKSIPLKKCQAIDSVFRYLKAEITPLEEHLKKQEQFMEIELDRLKEKVKAKREVELGKLEFDFSFIDLNNRLETIFKVIKLSVVMYLPIFAG